jgi:hypothetical protein
VLHLNGSISGSKEPGRGLPDFTPLSAVSWLAKPKSFTLSVVLFSAPLIPKPNSGYEKQDSKPDKLIEPENTIRVSSGESSVDRRERQGQVQKNDCSFKSNPFK